MERGRSSRLNTQATWELGVTCSKSNGLKARSENTTHAFQLLSRGDIAQFAEGAFDDVGRFAGDAAHGVEDFVEDIF